MVNINGYRVSVNGEGFKFEDVKHVDLDAVSGMYNLYKENGEVVAAFHETKVDFIVPEYEEPEEVMYDANRLVEDFYKVLDMEKTFRDYRKDSTDIREWYFGG